MCWQILGCVKPLDFLSPISQDSCVRMSSKKMARHFFHRTILTLPLAQIICNRFWYSSRHEKSVKRRKRSYILFVQTFHFLAFYAGGRGTPYNGLYGEAPPERGIFFRLQVYKRVGILLVEVYQRVGKSVISVWKKRPRWWILWLWKKSRKLYGLVISDLLLLKDGAFTAVKKDAVF